MVISSSIFTFSSEDLQDLIESFLSKAKKVVVEIENLSINEEGIEITGIFHLKVLFVKKRIAFKVALKDFCVDFNNIFAKCLIIEPKSVKLFQKKITKKLQKVLEKIKFIDLNDDTFVIDLNTLLSPLNAVTIHLDNIFLNNDALTLCLNQTEIDLSLLGKKATKDNNKPLLIEEDKEVVLYESKD